MYVRKTLYLLYVRLYQCSVKIILQLRNLSQSGLNLNLEIKHKIRIFFLENVVNHGQVWTALFNLGQHWPTLVNLAYFGQPWSTLVNLGQLWSTLAYLGQHQPTLVNLGQPWTTLVNLGQPWSTLVNLGQPFSGLRIMICSIPESSWQYQ